MKNKLKKQLRPTGGDAAERTAQSAVPTTNTADEFRNIARGELFPDPDQPRKTFTEASLNALAESIKEQGIVQPLIVRLVKAKYKIEEPDLTSSEYHLLELAADGHWDHAFQDKSKAKCLSFAGETNLVDRYVIVAGERRWRASEIAGLAELPCIVRDLDAHRVFAQQIIENNQREGVSDIEEAEAMEREFTRRKALDAGFSKETMAKELGMSRADFYGTLVLTRLHAPVRAALTSGKISTSVAKEVAKLPTPKAQEKLLKMLTDVNAWNYPFSVRDVQQRIESDYVRQLNDAPFDAKLTYCDSKAGILDACTNCPKRTGNMLDEFPELKSKPNVCTDTDCYGAKVRSYWMEQAKDEIAKGKTVLTEKEFKSQRTTLSPVDEYIYPIGKNGTIETLLGKHKPDVVLVAADNGLEKYFRKTDLPDAFKAAKLKFREQDNSIQSPEEKAKAEAKKKIELATAEQRKAYVVTQIPELMKALAKLKSGAAWALGVLLVKSHDGYCDDDIEAAAEKSKDDQARVLGFLFADLDNNPLDYSDGWDDHGVKLWKLAGIDLLKGFAVFEKNEMKMAQTALVMTEPKQKALVDVPATPPPKKKVKAVRKMSAAVKGRLMAKMKARWAQVKAAAKK